MAISFYMWEAGLDSTATDFSGWIAAQGSTNRSVAFGRDIVLSANTVVPSTIDIIDFYNNSKFTGNYTLTINKMSAMPRHQIFGTGVNVIWGSGAVPFVMPEWFGYTNQITTASGNFYFTGSGNFIGNVHSKTEPTVSSHLTTKNYVDNLPEYFEKSLNVYNPEGTIPTGEFLVWEYPYVAGSGVALDGKVLTWGNVSGTVNFRIKNGTSSMYNATTPAPGVNFIIGPFSNNTFTYLNRLYINIESVSGSISQFFCQINLRRKSVI